MLPASRRASSATWARSCWASAAGWRLERRDGALRLGFRRGAAALDPRTLFLLREEAQAWEKVDAPRLALIEERPKD
jgi:hypothetical protein